MNRSSANPLDISGKKQVGLEHELVPEVKVDVPLNQKAGPSPPGGNLAQAQTGQAVRQPLASRRAHRQSRRP